MKQAWADDNSCVTLWGSTIGSCHRFISLVAVGRWLRVLGRARWPSAVLPNDLYGYPTPVLELYSLTSFPVDNVGSIWGSRSVAAYRRELLPWIISRLTCVHPPWFSTYSPSLLLLLVPYCALPSLATSMSYSSGPSNFDPKFRDLPPFSVFWYICEYSSCLDARRFAAMRESGVPLSIWDRLMSLRSPLLFPG